MQWNNIKKRLLDTMSDLVGNVEKRARKPWTTQEMIVKWMNEGIERMSTTKEGRKEGRTVGD